MIERPQGLRAAMIDKLVVAGVYEQPRGGFAPATYREAEMIADALWPEIEPFFAAAGGFTVEPVPEQSDVPRALITINRTRYEIPAVMWDIRKVPFPPISDEWDVWRIVPGADDQRVTEPLLMFNGARFYTAPRTINAGSSPSPVEEPK